MSKCYRCKCELGEGYLYHFKYVGKSEESLMILCEGDLCMQCSNAFYLAQVGWLEREHSSKSSGGELDEDKN